MILPNPILQEELPPLRILLVDDEEAILSSLRRSLRSPNYFLKSFNDPRAALKHIEKNAYDLIISDYRMPNMDGVTLLSEARQYQPQAVRLILSGYTDKEALLDSINKAHIYQFICKPWDDHSLRQSVNQALGYGDKVREDQKLADQMRVKKGIITRHTACMRELERRYPGITRVHRDEGGAIIMNSHC